MKIVELTVVVATALFETWTELALMISVITVPEGRHEASMSLSPDWPESCVVSTSPVMTFELIVQPVLGFAIVLVAKSAEYVEREIARPSAGSQFAGTLVQVPAQGIIVPTGAVSVGFDPVTGLALIE